jgi:predicted RNA-binding protein YlxR (DUF448 family)
MTKTSHKTQPITGKRQPQRTCVACRQVKAKQELVRLVRTPEGNIELDTTGRRNGRGAYVCPTRECWEKALAGKQLERTLKSPIGEEARNALMKNGEAIFRGEN